MYRNCNVIGQMVSRLRYQRNWTQDELVARLQVIGCDMSRNVLANIETRRCVATDRQIEFLAQVFGVEVGNLFPPRPPKSNGMPVGICTQAPTRHRNGAERFRASGKN